jgi:Mg-chelatase subunit ChlD
MNDGGEKHWVQRVSAWIISAVIHGLIVVLLASLVLAVAREPVIEAVVQLEPVGRPDDPSASSAGGSAPRAQITGATTSSPQVAPLPAPPVDADLGSLPSPDQAVVPTDPTATDPALELLTELTQAASAQHTGRGDNPLVDGTSEGFQRMIGGIRGRGLDVVFVIDATDSMRGIMDQAKQRMHDIIGVITGVLAKDGKPPRNVRFGVVAFKDYGDDYGLNAVRGLMLTNDYQAVRDFIDRVEVGGGGDEPEPIHEALAAATIRKMGWRRSAKSIIVLIGDAPVHPSGRAQAISEARSFVKKYAGTVNTIDVNTQRGQVLGDFADIAKAGHGTATLLGSEEAFWEDLVVSVFGKRFEHDVRAIVERYANYR